jgi:hypothetical protein
MRIFENQRTIRKEIDRLTTEHKQIYHSEQLCEKLKRL